MGRIQRGLLLARASADALRRDPGLLVPAIVGFAVQATVVTLVVVAADGPPGTALRSDSPWALLAILTLPGVSVLTEAAVIARLTAGGAPGGGRGLLIRRLPKLMAWAAVQASVVAILRIFGQRSEGAGQPTAFLLGLTWSMAMVFVVPAILYEDEWPATAARRSAMLFATTWGENAVGLASITGTMLLIAVPIVILVAIPLGAVSGAVSAVVAIAALSVVVVVSSALTGIMHAALYRYAVGRDTFGFEDSALVEAVGLRTAPADWAEWADREPAARHRAAWEPPDWSGPGS